MASISQTVANSYCMVNSKPLISLPSRVISNFFMNIKDIRRNNLLVLKKEFGSFAALAKRTNTDASYLSQVNIKARDMGHDVARRIEAALGKTPGWMDAQRHDRTNAVEQPMALYSVNPVLQTRVLAAFDWLTPPQQEDHLKELEAMAEANRQAAKIFQKRIATADNERVEIAYGKPGDHKEKK
jgi:hypothetical protein